jgi:hypothetical protein
MSQDAQRRLGGLGGLADGGVSLLGGGGRRTTLVGKALWEVSYIFAFAPLDLSEDSSRTSDCCTCCPSARICT